MIQRAKTNWPIVTIVAIGFLLRFSVLLYYGPLTLGSDDSGYEGSALRLLESGMLTYHYPHLPTVHIMPGQSFLLAFLFWIAPTAEHTVAVYFATFIFILIGTMNIYLVYVITSQFVQKRLAWIAPLLLALYVPQILTDQLFVTETPFLFFLLLLVLFSLQLARHPSSWKLFFGVILSYFAALMFKATIALYPVVLLLYFITIRYPLKRAIRQFSVAVLLLFLILGPWWYRNYVQFDQFIPLTAGAGNPLLLGTYQGHGHIYDPSYEETIERINEENEDIRDQKHLIMQKQEEEAKRRIAHFWKTDRRQLLENYILYKTKHQWTEQFYWIELFGISKETVTTLFNPLVPLGIISLIGSIIFNTTYRKELIFLGNIILLNTILNSIFFAYGRYNQPFMFIWFIAINFAIALIIERVRKGSKERLTLRK